MKHLLFKDFLFILTFPKYPLHIKMKFSIKDFFNKFDQIHRFLRIWSHLLKKSLMENFTFYAVIIIFTVRTRILRNSSFSVI